MAMAATSTPIHSAAVRAARFPRWAWAAAGGAIGLTDFCALLAFDANLTVAGRDFTIPLFLLFLLPYSALGWAVGGLAVARVRADGDRATIAHQMASLERAQRALVQEEKLAGIGRLAAGVAHEVRNPLGVIRASASMARESFDRDTDPHRALGFVCEETDRLDRLIQALLTFAKPQPVECVQTDLPKVADRALELARHEAREADVELDVEFEAGLPAVAADPDRLSQAIYGLCLNAIQVLSSPPRARTDPTTMGTRRVRVAGRRRGTHVEIDVVDTGPGIPDALRDQIFEPFVTTRAEGTGLGLPMALRLIEAQSGSLELVEHHDPAWPGACFQIRLPLPTEAHRDER